MRGEGRGADGTRRCKILRVCLQNHEGVVMLQLLQLVEVVELPCPSHPNASAWIQLSSDASRATSLPACRIGILQTIR